MSLLTASRCALRMHMRAAPRAVPRACTSVAAAFNARRHLTSSATSAPGEGARVPPAPTASPASEAASSTVAGERVSRPDVEPMRANEYAAPNPNAAQRRTIEEFLRVDHAGEFGALRIYEGQLAVLRDPVARREVAHMLEQERRHLEDFEKLLPRYRARPTALLPLWSLAGHALGAATALLGPKAAMACTVAVEEVIVEHYDDQLRKLHEAGFEEQASLRRLIRANRDEEEQHKATAIEHNALEAPLYSLLSTVIKTGCHTAIWFAKRV